MPRRPEISTGPNTRNRVWKDLYLIHFRIRRTSVVKHAFCFRCSDLLFLLRDFNRFLQLLLEPVSVNHSFRPRRRAQHGQRHKIRIEAKYKITKEMIRLHYCSLRTFSGSVRAYKKTASKLLTRDPLEIWRIILTAISTVYPRPLQKSAENSSGRALFIALHSHP